MPSILPSRGPWALRPHILTGLAHSLARYSPTAGIRTSEPGPPLRHTVEAGVAIVPVTGIILKDRPPAFWEAIGIGSTALADLAPAFDAAVADPAADAVMLYVDSPGGEVAGVQELADRIFAARQVKPIAAAISDLGTSAAYWLASQAATVTSNATAEVGAIGVYAVVADTSEAAAREGIKVHVIRSGDLKGTGVAGAPITPPELAAMKEIIVGTHDVFVEAVARGRGRSVGQVRTLATGKTFLGAGAKAAGLIDGVSSFRAAVMSVGGGSAGPTSPTRRSSTPAPASYDDAMAAVLAEMGKSPDDLEARSAAAKIIRQRWPEVMGAHRTPKPSASTATTRTPAPSTGGPTTYAEAMAAVLAELGKSADDLDARSEAAKIIRQRFPETLGK